MRRIHSYTLTKTLNYVNINISTINKLYQKEKKYENGLWVYSYY